MSHSPLFRTASHPPSAAGLLQNPPAVGVLDQYIDEVDALVDHALGDLDEFGTVAPEVESRGRRVLRRPDPCGWLLDRILELTSIDDETWAVRYYVGDAGFDPADGVEIMSGELVFDGADRQNFFLAIDLDAAASMDPEIEGRGTIALQARTHADGTREVWCDVREAALAGEPPESSYTTYRLAPDCTGALEHVANRAGGSTRVSASWDATGVEIASSVSERMRSPSPDIDLPSRCAVGSGVHDTAAYETAETLTWHRSDRLCA
jgi:hypothetical protein